MSKADEYINFYEKELDKLEEHKQELLEVDKSTSYTDKKIEHIYNLLTILRNSRKTEQIVEENSEYRKTFWKIEKYIKSNNIPELLILLKEVIEYE